MQIVYLISNTAVSLRAWGVEKPPEQDAVEIIICLEVAQASLTMLSHSQANRYGLNVGSVWLKAGRALWQAAALHNYHGQANTCRICVRNAWWRCRPRGARIGQKSDRSHMNCGRRCAACKPRRRVVRSANKVIPPTVGDTCYARRGLWRAAPEWQIYCNHPCTIRTSYFWCRLWRVAGDSTKTLKTAWLSSCNVKLNVGLGA